jgi:peptide-methionine (S)-S-oxide reductase
VVGFKIQDKKILCTDKTGHTEVVLLEYEYDPFEVTHEELLTVFWNSHDPTTLNRQGSDVGTQYRSAVLFHNSEQKATQVTEEQLQNSVKFCNKKTAAEIVPASNFWEAEE